MATLLVLPCPGIAGPVEDALGDVTSGLPQAPSVGGLPALPETGPTGPGAPAPPGGGSSAPGGATAAPSTSQPASQPSPSQPAARPPSAASGGGSSPSAGTRSSTQGDGRDGEAAAAGAGTTARGSDGGEEPLRVGFSRGGERRGTPSIATRFVDRVPTELRAALFGLAGAATLFGLMSLRERRRTRRAEQDALADQLTGLGNRPGFDQRLAREWQRARRYERDLGIVMLDLDGFKDINDERGHLAGDRVLRETAAAISGRIRESDYAARLGGDEFVVLCPETGDRGLKALSDGLAETLARHSIAASVGFAQREPADLAPSELLDRADAAMYRRKRTRSGTEPAGLRELPLTSQSQA